MKITVVGSGFVGQTAAMRLLEKGLGDVVLIDIIEGKPQGLALDLKEAAPVEGYEPTIVGTNDYADTAGSDIVVITAGFPRQPGMSRMDLLGKNAGIVRSVVEQVAPGSPDAIVIVNATGDIVLVNSQTERMFGYPREELLGRQIEVLVPRQGHGQNPDQPGGFLSRSRSQRTGSGLELFGRRKDGAEFPIELSITAVRLGDTVSFSGFVRDITDRKLAEAALRYAALSGIEIRPLPILRDSPLPRLNLL